MVDHKIETTTDFDFLSQAIFQRIGVYISASTLKRIWGYSKENVMPRLSTLSFLAKFVGYKDWNDFCLHNKDREIMSSSHILNRCIEIEKDLNIGDKIRLSWLPDRICDIEYIGNLTFQVVKSQNSKLKVGATFVCRIIIENEPLYMDRLIQDSTQPSIYVCGKTGGVRFEMINQK